MSARIERSLLETIAALGCDAGSLQAYRSGVLDRLAPHVRYDAAIFHALSPRVPLSTAVVRGLDPAALARTVTSWDDLAVAFGSMRELANAAWVVTDQQAFPRRSRARAVFVEKVTRPFKQRSLCMVHLIVRSKVVAVIALFSRRMAAFDGHEVALLQHVAPTIALGDALQQQLDDVPRAAATTRLVCRDERLSSRQREIVEHVALGLTNQQIGDALGLSPHSIRNHLARVFERIGAANRADLIRLAVLTPSITAPSRVGGPCRRPPSGGRR